ncbi:hypothetical protein [Fluviicola taffensis]|uniref:Lipoprotein n=1 Tax=Fluviicola taffensis (strain DSM 16823 / NCIMB 13979 / RW262) TaxID=755732 RepID=F2IDB8_FLUTR|nr:hypothetical protein [Fluviicola taffensis]AEA45533.1 hypothetical protein Fluta_3564 [Fluviicola taffensis DSM 16823]
MKNSLKFGISVGLTTMLVSCGTSEHFMQDDVYNTRTPIMPLGTDLNDVTDYATYVAKKEQIEKTEQVAYVSPRQFYDNGYYNQYRFYGYSPYSSMQGIGYYGYGNSYLGYGNQGMFVTPHFGLGYSPYYGNNPYAGGYYNYHNPYNPYNPYSPYFGHDPYGYSYENGFNNGYYSPNYNNGSWGTPSSKPNTGNRNSNMSAGLSGGGRSSANNGAVIYPHKSAIAPGNNTERAGRVLTTRSNNGPAVNSGTTQPVSSSRRNAAVRPGSVSRPTVTNTQGSMDQQGINNPRTPNTTPSVNRSNTPVRTINTPSNNNSTPTRSSSPTIRSGGGGGNVSTPSGGGGRAGGRR